MRVLLILIFISMPAFAGLGNYLGRVTLGMQINRLLLVEVDVVSRASLSLIAFHYGKTLSPYERAQALVHEYSLAVALLDSDVVEVHSLLGKLNKLSDDTLSLTAGNNKIDLSARKNAAKELVNYSAKQIADVQTLKLDYEGDQLEFIRLKQFLASSGFDTSKIDGRRNERIRARKRIKRYVHKSLRALSEREAESMRETQARVTAVSLPLATEWPEMNPIGVELAANIFELVARSAPDEHELRTALEQVMHLGSGMDKIELRVSDADGSIVLRDYLYAAGYMDKIVDRYQED